MGFINFLKKILEKEEPKIEKIAFDDIGNYLENKTKEIKTREKEIFILIKNKISIVIKELDEKLRVLENIDVDSKKVENRIRLIVKENLNHYIVHVKNFIENLNNLKQENLEELIENINKIFLGFDKRSRINLEKATFLIGKEIAAVKISIRDLHRYLGKLFNENKDILDPSKIISLIKLKLKQIDEVNETTNRVNEEIMSLDKKITNLKEMNQNVLKKIKKIKESKGYIENFKKQEEVKSAEKELEKEFYKLKEIIDFKALANIFHVNRKKMDIIKAHKENFQAAYDGSILSLLDEAKLNNNMILTKLKQINDKKQEIIKNKQAIKKDEIQDLLAEIRKIKLDIESLNNEKNKELKIYNKLKTNRKEIIKLIKQEMEKINVIVSSSKPL